MAQDLADSLIPANLPNFFEKIWPPLSTNARLLSKLRPHLLSCVQVIQQQEPILFYEIVADQQEISTRAPTASLPSTLLSSSSDYTTTTPVASQLTLPNQRPCGIFPATKCLSARQNTCQLYEKSTSRTSSATKSLSTTPKSCFLPGLPETVRQVLRNATAEKFFKSGFGQNDGLDFFLALVQADTSKWLNAIKQRALSLATLHIRDRIVSDGYRGEKGYCNLTAKDVIVDVAAAYNPKFSRVRISELITENIDRGTRYSQLAQETSLSAAFSLCPGHAWWYEKRLPKSKNNESRKAFVSKLRAEGAKTDAEINEEFEQLRKTDQLNKDVEFAKRFQTKIQEILDWIYARCDAWLESGEHTAETMRCLVEQSSKQNGRERAKGQRSRNDTAPAPIQVLVSDNGATSVEIASNADLLSTPPALHHESLDVLANTALLQAQSQDTPSYSYADHHHATEAADVTVHQTRAATTLSSPSSAASLFDSSFQPHHLHARSSEEGSAALPSNTGQKRQYDGEEASTTKRQKSVSGLTASSLNNGVETVTDAIDVHPTGADFEFASDNMGSNPLEVHPTGFTGWTGANFEFDNMGSNPLEVHPTGFTGSTGANFEFDNMGSNPLEVHPTGFTGSTGAGFEFASGGDFGQGFYDSNSSGLSFNDMCSNEVTPSIPRQDTAFLTQHRTLCESRSS